MQGSSQILASWTTSQSCQCRVATRDETFVTGHAALEEHVWANTPGSYTMSAVDQIGSAVHRSLPWPQLKLYVRQTYVSRRPSGTALCLHDHNARRKWWSEFARSPQRTSNNNHGMCKDTVPRITYGVRKVSACITCKRRACCSV